MLWVTSDTVAVSHSNVSMLCLASFKVMYVLVLLGFWFQVENWDYSNRFSWRLWNCLLGVSQEYSRLGREDGRKPSLLNQELESWAVHHHILIGSWLLWLDWISYLNCPDTGIARYNFSESGKHKIASTS